MKEQLNDRQKQIYEILLRNGEVKINHLKELFGVVEMTVRRDLEKMEKLGLLYRTYGGAIRVTDMDISINEREKILMKAKEVIGFKAAQTVKPNEAIFIDAGTTTSQVAKHLDPSLNLIVVTNAINVALQLREKNIQKIIIGGILRDTTLSLVGPIAEETLSKMSFDKAFIGASGFSVENGFSNSNVFESYIKTIVIKQSKEVNIVIDHSKFGVKSLSKFATLSDVHNIFTDQEPDNKFVSACKESNTSLIIC
jgi:DeoR family transcriptional regulator, fructose operon transcriptional repressor